jgi:hypothetical protein
MKTNITIKKYLGWVLMLGLVFAACTDEDYLKYDTTQKDSLFFQYLDETNTKADHMEYVFNYDIATVHTVELPISLMGMPVDYDREIALKVIDENTTMQEGIHYTFDNLVLPANATESVIKINLLRDKDPEIQEKEFSLQFELDESDDLRSVGQNIFTITYSDIRPTVRPSWWTTWSTIPVYSFEAAQKFFEYFYKYAPTANPDVYEEMIEAYGDYFVKAKSLKGPFSVYTNFLKKYVLVPMYEDCKDDFTWQSVPTF